MTIGNFDGVHRGHRVLIEEMTQKGQQQLLPLALLTFSPHPSQVLSDHPVGLIYPLRTQKRIMEKLGISHLFVQAFDEGFSKLTSEDFLRQYLFRIWNPRVLVVGDDFGFGQDKAGGRELLGQECQSRNCQWIQCPTLKTDQGLRVSSSLLRKVLAKGEIKTLNTLLTEPYSIEGKVVRGQQLGRTLGFPTANIAVEDRLYPKHGVYYGRVTSLPESPWALVNLGVRPTVSGEGEFSVECHILDFAGDLYGQSLTFEFLGRLRDEMRFSGKTALVSQIQSDLNFLDQIRRKNVNG